MSHTREAWPGEFRAAHDPAIEPLVDWLKARLIRYKLVSANDVPRTLIADNNWRNGKGELMGNYAIGTALRRLEFDGLAYPAERIDAADNNESHRRVTVYRLVRTGGLDGDMETPAGQRLVGAAIALRARGEQLAKGPDMARVARPRSAEPGGDWDAAYQDGWRDGLVAIRRSIGWTELAGALEQMGSKVAE
jgi:hypothetical protein